MVLFVLHCFFFESEPHERRVYADFHAEKNTELQAIMSLKQVNHSHREIVMLSEVKLIQFVALREISY